MKKTFLSIGALMVLILVGFIVYQARLREPYVPQEPPIEEQIAEHKEAFFDNECLTSHQLTGVVGASEGMLTISYPCDWLITDVRDDFFRISSVDGHASFQWPAYDAGIQDTQLLRDMDVTIAGATYSAHEYDTDSGYIRLVDVPLSTATGDGGFLLTFTPDTHEDVLDAILSILSF